MSRKVRAAQAAVLTVVVLVVLIAGAVFVLSSLLARGNMAVSRQAVLILNRSVGTDSTRVEVGRVSGTLFRGAILDRPRLVVITPEGEVTWATARRIQIDYDLFGLLFSKERSLTAVIDSPIVRLVHDRAGRVVFPRFASRPARRGPGATTRVSIAAKNGFFSLDWKNVRFTNVQGQGVLTVAPGRSTLVLDELSGQPDPAARSRGRVRARGGMAIVGPALRVDPLEVAYGGSKVRAVVEWDLEKGRVSDGLLHLEPLRVGDIAPLVGAGKKDGVLRGEISFSGLPTDGTATACVVGTFEGEPIDTLAVTAALAPKTATFTGLRLRSNGAEATGGGTIAFGGPIQATLTFHRLDPAAIPWWKAPEGMPHGSLAGNGRLLLRPARPRGTVAAVIDLDEGRFGRLALRRGRLHWGTGADGSTVLDSSWIVVPGGRIAGRGRIGPDGAVNARVLAAMDDLSQADSLIAPVTMQAGAGRILADLSGPIGSPSFNAHALLWQGTLTNGVAFDSILADASGRLGEGGNARASLAARGVSASGRPLGHAVADVSFGKTITIERYVQRLGDSTLAFRGVITPGKRDAVAVLDSVELVAGTMRFRNVTPVRLTLGAGHVSTDALVLDTRPGSIDLAFDWDVRREWIEAHGSLEGIEARRIPGIAASSDSIGGMLEGSFRMAGPLADPNLAVMARVRRPSWSGVVGDSLTLDLEYAPGVLQVREARWAAADGRARVHGAIRAAVPLERWARGLSQREESWAKNAVLDLEGRVDSLDLSRLAPADTSLRTLAGVASFTARVAGNVHEPVASISLSAPRVTYRGVTGNVSGAELAYANRVLRIERFDVNQSGSVSSLTGEVPVDLSLFAKERWLRDRPLRLTVRMTEADFKIASVIFPAYIASSAGKISIMAGVSGTPRTPEVQGSVRLKDGMVRLAGREEVVERIQLEGAFDQNQLTVSKVTGEQGSKGRLTGSGTWQWGGLPREAMVPVQSGPPGRYEFVVKATNFTATDRETYLMQLTGTFTIQNRRTESGRQIAHATGSATLSKGNLTLDLADRSQEEVTLPFYYDVTVEVPGGLFYRTVDSEVELQGTLRLLNEGEGNLALGTMSVRKGRYYFFAREIRNLSGDFIFNSVNRTDPELAVDGETTVPIGKQQLLMKVSLTGHASRPVVHLWDPNPDSRFTQADLWKALTFGQLPIPGSETSSTVPGTELALPYLFRSAERWLSQSGWIDTFDLGARTRSPTEGTTGGNSLDIGSVGAGKYVTRDLYVNYSQEFTGQGERRVGAEYRLTRHLLLRGERTERQQDQNPKLQSTEYNLDLKVRLEY